MLPTILNDIHRERLALSALAARDLPGEVWECGVFRGGSAACLLNAIGPDKTLRLFDTFGAGVPYSSADDGVAVGRFDITDDDYQTMTAYFGAHPNVIMHKGIIAATFAGLEDRALSLVHLDVDIAQAYADCLAFVWPRLVRGGIVVLDDHRSLECRAATAVIDTFAAGNGVALNLITGWGAWMTK